MNYRQGDVLIFQRYKANFFQYAKSLPQKADNVIIEGEVSGHKHEVVNGKLYEDKTKGIMILEAKEGCKVVHPEHEPISIPKGIYEIAIQEEYDEEKHRTRVKD